MIFHCGAVGIMLSLSEMFQHRLQKSVNNKKYVLVADSSKKINNYLGISEFIRKGVGQVFVLSPDLFLLSMYTEINRKYV